MFDYKMERMALIKDGASCKDDLYRTHFTCEKSTKREDKIDFINQYIGKGKVEYLLSLIEKFQEEKHGLKRYKKNGKITPYAINKWLKANDPQKIFYVPDHVFENSEIGYFHIFGCKRYIEDPAIMTRYDVHIDIVDELFRRLLCRLIAREKEYFKITDDREVLKSQLLGSKYKEFFGVKIMYKMPGNELYICDEGDQCRPIENSEMKLLINANAKLENFAKHLAADIKITY